MLNEIQELCGDDVPTEGDVCDAEMLKLLTKALEALDERERDIIVFRYYFNKQLKEIAAQTGILCAYVRVLHNRALQNLRLFFGNQQRFSTLVRINICSTLVLKGNRTVCLKLNF